MIAANIYEREKSRMWLKFIMVMYCSHFLILNRRKGGSG
jgi:hypothetical protein